MCHFMLHRIFFGFFFFFFFGTLAMAAQHYVRWRSGWNAWSSRCHRRISGSGAAKREGGMPHNTLAQVWCARKPTPRRRPRHREVSFTSRDVENVKRVGSGSSGLLAKGAGSGSLLGLARGLGSSSSSSSWGLDLLLLPFLFRTTP